MRAIGRILQVIGWIWIAAGFIGPIFGLDVGSFFPGIIVLFVSRFLRGQTARQEKEDEQVEASEQTKASPPVQGRPVPTPASPPPRPEPVVVKSFDPPEMEPESSLEDVRAEVAGIFAATLSGESADSDVSRPEGEFRPKSSAEMIAEARRRWNKDS